MKTAWPVCALAVLLAACSPRGSNVLPGTLERDRIELVAEASEFIAGLPVAEGARVKTGDVVVVQDDTLARADLDAARAQLAEAEARLAELVKGPRTTTIRAAIARRDAARVMRDEAVRERDRLRELVSRQLVSQAEADRQTAAADAAAAELRAAEAALRELEEGTRAEQVQQARLAADTARARLASLQTTSARLEVRAPVDALVDALPYHVGEKPPQGATVAVLLADTPPYARIHVPEPIRARVKAGTPATIRVDGLEREFRGQVRFISSEAEFTPYFALTEADRSRLSFRAEVAFDDADDAALPAGVPLVVTLEPDAP